MDCLRQGSNRYAHNIVRGKHRDRDFHAFDFHYETDSRDNKGKRQTNHHHFSAVIIETALSLKALFIRPERFFDRVTEFFGLDDIDFESAEFSRSFYVKAADRKWAFDVIHQQTMEIMLASPPFSLQFAGHHVIAWTGRRFNPVQFESALDVAGGILDRLPDSLIQEMNEAAA